MTDNEVYDVIMIGAGPAGLAAGLYAARDRYKCLLLERNGLPGGQIMLTDRIENYPGWETISGPDLVTHQVNQAKKFGAEIATGKSVENITRREDGLIEIEVNRGKETYVTRAVILTPGSDYRQLGVPGETELRQVGKVSYCATCDGAFYRDKRILTVGGGNTAVEDTIYLANQFTDKITIAHRRTEFRAQKILVEELYEVAAEKGLNIKLPYVLERIVATEDGNEIDHVELKNVDTGEIENIEVDGVFIFVGMVPNTKFLEGIVEINDAGYIACDPVTLKTSTPGIYVAGDSRQQASMQLATACADGVVAAMQLKDFFRDPSAWTAAEAETEGPKGW